MDIGWTAASPSFLKRPALLGFLPQAGRWRLPYKGSAPALTDVVAGHVPLLFSDPVPALPLIREGKVRVLGVSTKTRSPSAPDIPPIAEAGVPGFDAAGWGVFSVPAGTPKEVVSKLQTALTAVLAMPEVQQQIVNLGMIPSSSSASSAPRSRAGARSWRRRAWRARSSAAA